eukprot:4802139-Amphidinium_carterae.1
MLWTFRGGGRWAVSLTVSDRIHLPENKQFYNALDNIFKLYTGSLEHGRDRLAQHIASFFGSA